MRTWRSGRKLSQAKVAELFDLSQASYSKMEAGETDVALSTLGKAAEVTDIAIPQLLGLEAAPEGVEAALRTLTEAGFEVSVRQPIPAPAAPPGAERKGSHP